MSGALLMPRSRVKLLVEAFLKDANAKLPLDLESEDTSELKQRMSVAFDVSREAAGRAFAETGSSELLAPLFPHSNKNSRAGESARSRVFS